MSRILVTGASGFVGRAVIAALAKDGHAVRAAVRRSTPAFSGNIELVQHGDLAGPVDWSRRAGSAYAFSGSEARFRFPARAR